jgi:hypothetical protein
MTILKSVRRQLKDKENTLKYLEELKVMFSKNQGLTKSVNRKIFDISGIILQISESLSMMEQGYSFTNRGWVKLKARTR